MRFASHVQWREEKFGAVLFDTLREKVYVTNETGRDMLPLVERGLCSADIAEGLLADYSGHPPEVYADVVGFLAELRAAGLIADGEEAGQ